MKTTDRFTIRIRRSKTHKASWYNPDMKTHTFHLIRHGEKEKTIGNPPLTVKGKQQAESTAKYLKTFGKIEKILASPKLRTRQTAEIIAKELQQGITESELLLERANWGDLPSQTYEEFVAMWLYASSNRTWNPQVGVSSNEAGERLKRMFQDIQNENIQQTVLITHGGIITDFLRSTFSSSVLNTHLENFSQDFEERIPECSITTVQIQDGEFKLVCIANTDHLTGI